MPLDLKPELAQTLYFRSGRFKALAKDVVQSDPAWEAKLVNFLLQHVYIFTNLDCALKAYQQVSGDHFYLVTLDGEVIESSGVIIGGFVKQNHSGIIARKTKIKQAQEIEKEQAEKLYRIEQSLTVEKQARFERR